MLFAKDKFFSIQNIQSDSTRATRVLALIIALEASILANGCGIIDSPNSVENSLEQSEYGESTSIEDLLERNCPGVKISSRGTLQTAVSKASKTHNVHERLILAVITVESRCKERAVSPVGARGAMQLMPSTARWLGVRNIHCINDNIHGGTKYLAHLLDEFDYDLELALAAYNAGPTKVKRYRRVPPIKETRDFVRKVMTIYHDYLAAV